jgi:DNA-binding response OmpR family regulator
MDKTILLVEDDTAIREALSLVLENEGYKVSVVTNGREALDWLREATALPDLILLDLMMPEMDGMEFRKVQVMDQRLASIPVIMLTASPGLAKDLSSISEETITIVPKPLVIETLVEAIEACVNGVKESSQSSPSDPPLGDTMDSPGL